MVLRAYAMPITYAVRDEVDLSRCRLRRNRCANGPLTSWPMRHCRGAGLRRSVEPGRARAAS